MNKLLITLLLVGLMIVGVASYFVFFGGESSVESTQEKEEGILSDEPIAKATTPEKKDYISEFKNCLDQEMDKDCKLLFTSPGVIEYCNKINTDACYYQAAINNVNSNYCSKIKNSEFQEKCVFEIEDFLLMSYEGEEFE